MPIYEYRCTACSHEFERLIRPGDAAPVCPKCSASTLDRLLSLSAISSEGTRDRSIKKARARAKLVQRDKDVAQAEYERKHHEEGH
jgi:putative FmdB family regulatory protein